MSSLGVIQRADRIANRLVSKLEAPECREFFCKCAYCLTENQIEVLLERALKPGIISSKKYFTKTAKILMSKYPKFEIFGSNSRF